MSSNSSSKKGPCDQYNLLTMPEEFLECMIQQNLKQYGPKGAAYLSKLRAEAMSMAQTLVAKVQSGVDAGLSRVESDMQKAPKLEKMADQFVQKALGELDAWIDREVDNLIHSLAPLLAWIVALLLFYQVYGGVFDTMPVAYRLAIATLVVITIPPSLRSKFDFMAAPSALSLFGYILFLQRKKK